MLTLIASALAGGDCIADADAQDVKLHWNQLAPIWSSVNTSLSQLKRVAEPVGGSTKIDTSNVASPPCGPVEGESSGIGR